MDHLSLVELNILIQKTLKNNLEPSYWVVAEIGQLSVNQKGHCYLELIENENNRVISKIKATIWSYTYSNLSTWFQGITGQPLAEGLKILANVKISYHELYGLSLNIQDIDATYTIGEREKQRQEIINKLVADGVMEMNKELPLPLVPQNIAIISSPTAAGYDDFSQHLKENPKNYLVKATLFDAMMQGTDAPASIINALQKIDKKTNIDLVVIIRGGGSQLDLECFNDYDLCSHIAQFPLPVITGIGHERDETIADMVAHTKLKTPTAVAEFILQGIFSFESKVDDAAGRISQLAKSIIQSASNSIININAALHLGAQNITSNESYRLNAIKDMVKSNTRQQVNLQLNLINKFEDKHRFLDPNNALKRGFSFTTFGGKSMLNNKISVGNKITTYSLNQILESSVTTVKANGKI